MPGLGKRAWRATRLTYPALVLLALACSGQAAVATSPADISTIVVATLQAITPASSAALASSPTPTAISATPTAMPAAPPIRVSFLAGATSGVVTGTIQPGQAVAYVLQAGQDQPMLVNVQSEGGDVTCSIKTQGGTWLLDPDAGQSSWKGTLPQTEDYVITLYGAAQARDYTLTVEIASRVKFAPGGDAIKVSGATTGGLSVAYTLFALKDQKAEIAVYGVGQDAALSIWGFANSDVLLAPSADKTSVSFKFPTTQDYIIQLLPKSPKALDFVLFVKIQ